MPANGVTLAGFKFMTIKAEPDEVVGRKGVSGRVRALDLRSRGLCGVSDH